MSRGLTHFSNKRKLTERTGFIGTLATSLITTTLLIGSPTEAQPKPLPTIPTVEALALANNVAPNASKWRQHNETLTEENEALKAEVERLKASAKAAEVSAKETYEIYEVTAYTSGYESTQKRPGEVGYGITASGVPVKAGVTVACPPDLAFGTRVDIEGVGVRTCEDRGGAITAGHIDVYIPSLREAQEFGRKRLKVRILK